MPNTRLRVGMEVAFGGARYRVGLVNYSRARLDPIEKVKRKITTRGGDEVEIMKFPASVSISPNSNIEIYATNSKNPAGKSGRGKRKVRRGSLQRGSRTYRSRRKNLARGVSRGAKCGSQIPAEPQ